MNLADLINDNRRLLTGLSPSERIRIEAKARNLSVNDAEAIQAFVDESCKAITRRLDELVDKTIRDIRRTLNTKGVSR